MNIAYYISGHGYGHAVRSIEVIKSLAKDNDHQIHIRTFAPQWLFNGLTARVFCHCVRLEVGALQENSFSVAKEKTLQAYADLLKQKSALLSAEKEFLKQHKIDVVVSDITPFAFDAADELNIPAIAIGNFSWDWIYSPWFEEFPRFNNGLLDIQNSYKKANKLLRLPFYGDMSVFPNIVDIPLIGRKASLSKNVAREMLGLSGMMQKTILLGLRYDDIKHSDINAVRHIKEYRFLTRHSELKGENFIYFSEGDLPFEDIVNACDAVLSKPGYSMVAECIVNRTPFLYVPRDDFLEDIFLRKGLLDFSVCQELAMEDFISGNWLPFLNKLFSQDRHWPEIELNGEFKAAEMIRKAVAC